MPVRKQISRQAQHRPARFPRFGGTPIVHVRPRHDNAATFVRHPTAGGFTNPNGTAWPSDQFTHRRVRDGDIEIVPDPNVAVAPDAPALSAPAKASSDLPAAPTKPPANKKENIG